MSEALDRVEVDGEVEAATSDVEGVAGMDHRYMTFELDSQFYGIELASVQEIVRAQRATPVPDVPDFVRGVINLRGTVVPVVDVRRLRHLLGRDVADLALEVADGGADLAHRGVTGMRTAA